MHKSSVVSIPFERKADPMSNRLSGAAALCMVYRSFDKDVKQADICQIISSPDAGGALVTRPHLLAVEAQRRGLSVLVFQAADPVAAMRACQDGPIRLILNHRLSVDLPAAHYTVLVDLEEQHAVVHDPHYGPGIRVLLSDLRKMWQPRQQPSEIVGNVLIAFGPGVLEPGKCRLCSTQTPPSVPCPQCGKAIGLQPAAALGCVAPKCAARTWTRIFCPTCNASLTEVIEEESDTSVSSIAAIPFEWKADPMSNRLSGAAALCMVYRSFGKAVKQRDIWLTISPPNALGVPVTRSHLLAADAHRRGLFALVVQAADPVAAMRACHDRPIRLILNHRLNVDLPAAHYTVLIDLEDEHAVVHDPHYGPGIRVLHSDLRKMWQPRQQPPEIVGNVLIAFGPGTMERIAGSLCGTQSPPLIACPECGRPIALQPAAVLGCVAPKCAARTWTRVFCPACDAGLSEVIGVVSKAVIEPQDSALAGADRCWDEYNLDDRLKKLQARLQRLPGGDGGWGKSLNRSVQQFQATLVDTKNKEREAQKQKNVQAFHETEAAGERKPAAPAAIDGNELGVQMFRSFGLLPPEPVKPAVQPTAQKPSAKLKRPPPKRDIPNDKDRGIFDTV